jgi:hypothetical protein
MLSSVAKQERPFDATSINEEAAARMSSQIHDHARMPIESAASVARGPCIDDFDEFPGSPEENGEIPSIRGSRDGDAVRIEK